MPNDPLDAQFGSTDARYELLDGAQRRLEAAWKAGTQVDLAQFVPPVDHPWHDWVLVRLISVDRDCRWERDCPKVLDEYLDDWPILRGRSDLLTEVFGNDENEIVRKPSSTLVIGRRFDRYEIRERLGQGAMGTVYLAWDDRLRRNVALKIPHDVDDPCVRRRFLRESHIAAAVDHPNVCRIHDAGELDGICYLSMAFVRGISLDALCKQGTIAIQRACEWACDLALALDELHRVGIIHRDIKPSNVIIDERGQPVLMDFGLARRMRGGTYLTKPGMAVGSLAYMSPEQALGKRLDERADIYSLGVLLFELLAGTPPFCGSAAEVFTAVLQSNPPRLHSLRNDISAGLEDICQKALRKIPEDRYQSGRELVDALRADLDGRSSSMPKPSGNQIGRIVIEYAAGSVQSRTEDLEVFELAKDEMLVVGDVVRVVVVEIRGDRCKLGIEGDPECFVHRGEILAALQKDRRSEELDKGSAIDS